MDKLSTRLHVVAGIIFFIFEMAKLMENEKYIDNFLNCSEISLIW